LASATRPRASRKSVKVRLVYLVGVQCVVWCGGREGWVCVGWRKGLCGG
jgi:hypothetical protein